MILIDVSEKGDILFVEQVKLSDCNELIDLYNQLISYQKIKCDSDFSHQLQKLIELENYHILGVRINEKIVATCTVIILPNLTHNLRPFAIIENVVTDKKYRKKGFGTELINQSKKIAVQSNCHKILIQTRSKLSSKIRFYEKNGFVKNQTTGFQLNIEELEYEQ